MNVMGEDAVGSEPEPGPERAGVKVGRPRHTVSFSLTSADENRCRRESCALLAMHHACRADQQNKEMRIG